MLEVVRLAYLNTPARRSQSKGLRSPTFSPSRFSITQKKESSPGLTL